MNRIKKLVVLLCATLSLNAMQRDLVTIVDHNSNQKLDLSSGTLVWVFGATPRYAFFVRFMHVLSEHLDKLNAQYAHGKSLKYVPKLIKSVISQFKETHPELNPAQALKSLSLTDKMHLFFELGFEQKLLSSNFAALTKCVATLSNDINLKKHFPGLRQHLIHVLMPCYLDGCAELLNAEGTQSDTTSEEAYPLTLEKLHLFLKEAALFYKKLHEQNMQDHLTTTLFIPSLHYFEAFLELSKKGISAHDKEESISTILQLELLPICLRSKTPMMLVNQNKEELNSLIKRLISKGIDPRAIGNVDLAVSTGLKLTKIFNPYVIKKDKSYEDYHISPIVKLELLPFLLKGAAQ